MSLDHHWVRLVSSQRALFEFNDADADAYGVDKFWGFMLGGILRESQPITIASDQRFF
jgi:hypothetical protein